MNAACVSYCDISSMDSYYGATTAQGREHQTANPFSRTFSSAETKYSPTFPPAKGQQPYGEKSRSSPFQQECPSLDGTEEGTFSKYQLFMQRPGCKTPPEGGKMHGDGGLNGSLVSCFGEYKSTAEKPSDGNYVRVGLRWACGGGGGRCVKMSRKTAHKTTKEHRQLFDRLIH